MMVRWQTVGWHRAAGKGGRMEKDRSLTGMIQEFVPLVCKRLNADRDGSYRLYSDLARTEAENEAVKEEITRLKTALAEAKSQVDCFHGTAPMQPAVDALLHQAKLLSALIFERDRITTRFENER
jgi:hypothetical protein